MASAAAVAANIARSPRENDIGADEGRPGEITSGIYSKDDGLPDVNGTLEGDNDDELPFDPLQGRTNVNGNVDKGEYDTGLFGDEEDEGNTGRPA